MSRARTIGEGDWAHRVRSVLPERSIVFRSFIVDMDDAVYPSEETFACFSLFRERRVLESTARLSRTLAPIFARARRMSDADSRLRKPSVPSRGAEDCF